MQTDSEIARAAKLEPIAAVGERIGLPAEALVPYGHAVAKVETRFVEAVAKRPGARAGKLILVTAVNPTPAGEGKTTTTVGLADALRRIGKSAAVAMREPSLAPCFGTRGAAAGGGYAQVVPAERINLHFTGDFHAVAAANNLLAAMIDSHIHHGNGLTIDPRRVTWARASDMNDRALRQVTVGLGEAANGPSREARFDITAASEIMGVFCLARDLADLQRRLARIVVGLTRGGEPVTADQLQAVGSLAVLLRDAFAPNLVQTLEGTPAFVHGGPFGHLGHGCNSLVATDLALAQADYVVSEAGYGADLGAEKFFNIKCRAGQLEPQAAVVVATARALKMHGGAAKEDLGRSDLATLRRGMANLGRHVANVRKFGVAPVVALNAFSGDAPAELDLIRDVCRDEFGVEAIACRHWAQGGEGAVALAEAVVALAQSGGSRFQPLYALEQPIAEKMRIVAGEIYGAGDVVFEPRAEQAIAAIEAMGFGHLPICVAKTPYSFTATRGVVGAPSGHVVPVTDARLLAGAGFVVLSCGDIATLPGLPENPSAHRIGLDAEGEIVGLF